MTDKIKPKFFVGDYISFGTSSKGYVVGTNELGEFQIWLDFERSYNIQSNTYHKPHPSNELITKSILVPEVGDVVGDISMSRYMCLTVTSINLENKTLKGIWDDTSQSNSWMIKDYSITRRTRPMTREELKGNEMNSKNKYPVGTRVRDRTISEYGTVTDTTYRKHFASVNEYEYVKVEFDTLGLDSDTFYPVTDYDIVGEVPYRFHAGDYVKLGSTGFTGKVISVKDLTHFEIQLDSWVPNSAVVTSSDGFILIDKPVTVPLGIDAFEIGDHVTDHTLSDDPKSDCGVVVGIDKDADKIALVWMEYEDLKTQEITDLEVEEANMDFWTYKDFTIIKKAKLNRSNPVEVKEPEPVADYIETVTQLKDGVYGNVTVIDNRYVSVSEIETATEMRDVAATLLEMADFIDKQ